MRGIIYKATNTLNGEVYIGQTTQSLERRKAGHRAQAGRHRGNDPFHDAIMYYGWDSFSWEIIETIEREIPSTLRGAERYIMRPIMLAAEARYIDEYRSYDPRYGYNSQGGPRPSERRLEQLTDRRNIVTVYHIHKGRRYKTFPTFTAAREEIGIGPLHRKAIDYNPETIILECPRCVTCVAVRFPEGTKPPLNIRIKAIRPETPEMKKARRFHESPWMLRKAEERRKRLEDRLNKQDLQQTCEKVDVSCPCKPLK